MSFFCFQFLRQLLAFCRAALVDPRVRSALFFSRWRAHEVRLMLCRDEERIGAQSRRSAGVVARSNCHAVLSRRNEKKKKPFFSSPPFAASRRNPLSSRTLSAHFVDARCIESIPWVEGDGGSRENGVGRGRQSKRSARVREGPLFSSCVSDNTIFPHLLLRFPPIPR